MKLNSLILREKDLVFLPFLLRGCMVDFRDQVKQTRKGFSSIENLVSFSGADITVVAYRNETPASRFAVDNLKKEIEIKEVEIQRQRKAKAIASEDLTAVSDLNIAQIENIAKRRNQLRASGVPEDSTAMSSLNNKEGKYAKQVSAAAAREAKVGGELVTLNGNLDDLQRELKIQGDVENYFELGSIHTLSYSSFREKFGVRALGTVRAKDYTRGPRTIAGTMAFNVFQEHDFLKLVDNIDGNRDLPPHPHAVMIDQVQPFNVLLLFANEYGAYSSLHLLNVDISSEGQEMSVDSIITYNTMNFYATDMIPMTNLGNRFNSYDEMIIGSIRDVADSGLSSAKASSRNRIDALTNPFKTKGEANRLLKQSRGSF